MATHQDSSRATRPQLRRELSLTALVLYGLGTTIGAGIYALTGEVAGEAGSRAPLAFLVASLLAAATGLGFAELTGRLPKAAGEAVFVRHAFGLPILSRTVGAAVVLAGLVAGAAISDAFGGYLSDITSIPKPLAILGLVVGLGAFAIVGVKTSVSIAAAFTMIEVAGLGIVLWTARNVIVDVPAAIPDMLLPSFDVDATLGVLSGAFLAFFAFLGFEDIDSVAEETRDASRTLPRAIIWTLVITTVLYVTVAIAAVMSVDPAVLAQSDAPIADVTRASGGPGELLGVIGTLAMVNGALVQIVMVPRILYGMANLGDAPPVFARVHTRTATPVIGTVVAMALIATLAVSLELGPLARITSALTIGVFATVNASLLRIKVRDGPPRGYEAPIWIPALGLLVSLALFAAELWALTGL